MSDAQMTRARDSLQRIQQFDVSTLPQEADLGRDFNFKEVVPMAERTIELFRQYPIDFLHLLPATQLNAIATDADSFYQLLSSVLDFDPKQGNPSQNRTNIINSINNQYQGCFDRLNTIIAYGATRARDFGAMERDFRASMQRMQDEATVLTTQLNNQRDEAKQILEDVRKVAAETGVSQMAIYFQQEGIEHKKAADLWQKWTIRSAIGLTIYAAMSAFVFDVPGLVPTTSYAAVELGISKALVFVVIAYLVLLCGRNFMSHTHNEIVNRHRQNALLTFKALVDAAGSEQNRDVVLSYAAACIFAPQDTGYAKSGGTIVPDMPPSFVQAIPKLVAGTHM